METKLFGRRLAPIISLVVCLPIALAEAADLDALLTSDPGSAPASAPRPSDPGQPPEAPQPTIPPPAAQDRSARAIEEIIVTAQRKEQTLREVPISLSVIDDEFIQQASITDFRDLATYVPGVSVSNASEVQYLDVRIRGFGSPIANKAFEQPVGLVIDSIPYGRVQYWQGPLFDLDRVEVLRGPQGTLFGKNTTAGLFNVTTKKPTEELTGFLSAELGELDRRRFEGAIGGPLLQSLLSFRLSALSDERGGFMENTTARVVPGASDRLNERDRKAVRAQLGFPDLLGADLVIGYEHVESTSRNIGWEIRTIADEQAPFFIEYDPNSDFEPGNEVGSNDRPGFFGTRIDTFVANAGYDFRGWGLHLVAGYSALEAETTFDSDFTTANILPGADSDRNPQTTAELRVDSPDLPGLLGLEQIVGFALGRTNFSSGFFFQDREITDSRLDQSLHLPRALQLVATDATGVVPPCPACATDDVFETISVLFGQTSQTLAGFGHLNWYFADRWTLGYGMRFTQEEKEASWDSRFTRGSGVGFAALLQAEEFATDRSRSEFAFTPKVTLGYDWTDQINFYAGWGEGFKGGGFNGTIFNDNAEEGFSYEPEKAVSWELGTKAQLLDGTATVNVGLFRQTVTDLQVFSVTSDTQLLVQNAGEARSQGIETDLTWLPTDWLTLRGTLAFTDSEYLKFPFGGCPVDRPNSDGDADSRCDLSGRPLQFTPKWTSTLTPIARIPVASLPWIGPLLPVAAGVDLTGSISVEYKDVHSANENLDPRERQPSFFRVNGDLGFGNLAQGWSLRLVAQNLTDTDVASRIQQVSVVGRSFSQLSDPPRLVFGELRWQF